MEIVRGDIFYIRKGGYVQGSEQEAGRPAIVVSNDKANKYSGTLEVVYLTTQEKSPLPTHVDVMCKLPSTALCEQIHSVDRDRFAEYVRSCTDEEMREIDKALMISLGLSETQNEWNAPIYKFVGEEIEPVQVICMDEALIRMTAERDVYMSLYKELLGVIKN